MIITHETTIEEYEAWLATYPPLSLIQRAKKVMFSIAGGALKEIKKLVNRVSKNRSCLTGKATKRSNSAACPGYSRWKAYISFELEKTTRHVNRLLAYELIAERKWEQTISETRVAEELVMEELLHEALTHLNK